MPMPLVKRALIALAAVLLIAGVTFAQDSGGARQQQPAASVASGELVKIDTSAKTIVIKTESDPQMQFSYTDATKITGADKGVAGLATMTGSSLTIRYTKKGEDNVATEIVVQPKKS
jgi:uncharacterized protein YdbL (DUF1318 family)